MAPALRRARVENSIPTASMADIAFLLLIFFLVTTVFDEEKGLRLLLPVEDTIDVRPENILFLMVRPDGLIDVRRGESPRIQRVRHTDISGIWRLELADNPKLIAAVKTYPDAAYRYMIDVLDQLKAAGAERISLQMMAQ
jgi:biopolymer transport protein ExbD